MISTPEMRVIEFASIYTGVKRERINLDSKLEVELGCTGVDAEEFIRSFFIIFNVDGQSFLSAKHIRPENAASNIARWWGKKNIEKYPDAEISIKMLVDAASTGVWRF